MGNYWIILVLVIAALAVWMFMRSAKPHRVTPSTTRKGARPVEPPVDPFSELLQSSYQTPSVSDSVVPPRMPPAIAPEPQAVQLLELTVQLGFAVARADGRLAQAEREVIEARFAKLYSHDPAMLNRAKTLGAHYAKASIDRFELFARIKLVFPPVTWPTLLAFAHSIVEAGNVNAKKQNYYQDLVRSLGVTNHPTPVPVATRVPSEAALPRAATRSNWLKDLEIPEDVAVTAELVRRQYNKLSDRFAAAKVAHLGEEFERLAAERHGAARRAAEALMKDLGEPLERPQPPPPAGIRDNRELDELFGG